MPENSFYLIDWTGFSSKIHGTNGIIDELGLNGVTFENIKGMHGYKDRLYYESISIHYNGREDMGVWCEMSGQGCRAFETYGHGDFRRLFGDVLYDKPDTHITRIDVAFDDHDGILDMKQIFWDTVNMNFVSRFDDYTHHGGSKGMSCDFGRKGSPIMIRIYDKAAERKLTDGSHWVRVELQLRNERAEAFAKKYVDGGDGAIGEVFLGVLNNYLRFVVPDGSDTNRWRWEMADYWSRFIGEAGRIKLFQNPGVEYNMMNLENFVVKQAGNAISTYIEIKGIDAFLDDIKKRGTLSNPKYELLKAQFKKK